MVPVHPIAWDLGIYFMQFLEFFLRYHRVFEKTAAVPQCRGVGELLSTDGDHRIGNVPEGRVNNALPTELPLYGPIGRMQLVVPCGQPQGDRGDDVPVLGPLLEDGVPIPELAGLPIEAQKLPVLHVHRRTAAKNTLPLHAPPPAILYSAAPHLP